MQLARHSMRPTGTITPSSWPRCSEWSEDAAIWSKRNGLTRRMEPPRRSKRARKAHDTSSDRAPLHELLSHAKLTIFSGAGISVSSGIPTFTEKNGIYAAALASMGIASGQPGWKAFSYTTYERHPEALRAFLASLWRTAAASAPGAAHARIQELQNSGRLVRHYTMNIDGLSLRAGEDRLRLEECLAGAQTDAPWSERCSEWGTLHELHGTLHEVFCGACGHREPMDEELACRFEDMKYVPCPMCDMDLLRPAVLLYDDISGEKLSPESIFRVMKLDVSVSHAVLWLGVSFEQSATCEYFRRVLAFSPSNVLQVVVNPDPDCLFNLCTACPEASDETRVQHVQTTVEDFLAGVVSKGQKQGEEQGHAPCSKAGPAGDEGIGGN